MTRFGLVLSLVTPIVGDQNPVNLAAARAQSSLQAAQQQGGRQTYSVLLIVTDGAVSDIPRTAACLEQVHDSPLSIIIVGAQLLNSKEHCFELGKGFAESVAHEGALKIKEMCYLHAEGYSGGALKHGPFALIENDKIGRFGATPIILIILDDTHADLMRTGGEEIKACGAKIIVITDNAHLARDLDPDPVVIPSNGYLTALGAVVPLQLIAYELAMIRYV